MASLTGSESSPAKATEAAQKTDISQAKEDVQITAVSAQNKDGQHVIQTLESKYSSNNKIGNATISVQVIRSGSTITGATIQISTNSYRLNGTVDANFGDITWGEVTEIN